MFVINDRELAEICRGTLLQGSDEVTFSGVSIDSRTIKNGDVFFAIKGEKFDGHSFIEAAFNGGAAGAVVSSGSIKATGRPLILVEDTLEAFQHLSAWWRRKFSCPLVAITGSSGKTTTKDILASLLAVTANVHCNTGNHNNEIGVPLTLLGLKEEHGVCVLEMGMRGLGEIESLCDLARPTAGIITNVGSTHFGRLGSAANIARAKGELAASLPPDGFIMLNADNQWSPYISSLTQASIYMFGLGGKADVRASDLDFSPERTEFTLNAFGVSKRLIMPLRGEHNVYNCLAAIGVYLLLGFSEDRLQEGLNSLSITGMRLEEIPGMKGSKIINDAYNANPSSMLASLNVLKQMEGSRKIAVLGDMFELGNIAEREHRRVGEAVSQAGVDLLVTTGNLAAYISDEALVRGMEKNRVFHVSSVEEAAEFLKKIIDMGDVVLVKGSRGMKMESIVTALQAQVEDHV